MCRWMAWLGQPVLVEELLFNTQHGIVDQSLHSRMGAETTNGDGFGLGWYGEGEGPGLYRSVSPAWADANLRELAGHVETPLFLAHVRAAIGSPVQQSNCHPFRHGKWLFVHNGYVDELHAMRRDLMLAVDPERFPDVVGSTDTEIVFQLALTLGLEDNPLGAMERAVGLIEATGRRRGLSGLVQGTFGISDGETLWAIRYASEGTARTLFASADVDAIKRLYPDNARLRRLGPDDRLIVSEPIADLPGLWKEIPQSSAVTVRYGGDLEHRPFRPLAGAPSTGPSTGPAAGPGG
jgi:predicted glutamine amidotransferase